MQRFAIAILALFVAFSAAASEKKSTKTDAEAHQRAAEAELEEATINSESALKTPILRGTFALTEEDKNSPKVIGTFTVGANEYRVEISREALRSELEALNGKVASLSGKLRDGGKTFIVQTIERGGPPPAAMSNPRGL